MSSSKQTWIDFIASHCHISTYDRDVLETMTKRQLAAVENILAHALADVRPPGA